MLDLTVIKSFLGNPFYEAEGVLLYNMDCLEAMRRLEGDFVSLTVTSPPYNIGKEYERLRPLEDYLDWCEAWMLEIHKITINNGAFWLNLGYLEIPGRANAVPLPYLLWDRSPFYLVQEVVWNYGAGVHTKRMFSPRNEKFLWYVKSAQNYTFHLDEVRDKDVKYPNQKKNGKLKCNPLGKNPSDVWQIPKVTSGTNRSSKERTAHPAQFPLAVIDRIVKACSNVHEIVMDPFMGSGTTALAALQNERRVLGFEISEYYCALARQRIEQWLAGRRHAALQPALF
ncbi:MAG: site-specific DNA-methyltransferase [Ktedonobacteraceae bacterium]|nr:site-specific DNA-methyltransferase [Ktedonobacteraceae bacterium]